VSLLATALPGRLRGALEAVSALTGPDRFGVMLERQ
jgi:hypothetical protein